VDPETTPTNRTLGIVLWGADGRMGRAIDALVADEPSAPGGPCRVVARPGPDVEDLAGALGDADVAIDFTRPEGTRRLAEAAADAGVPLVVGTTALDAAARDALDAAARAVPVVVAPNTSQGVTVLFHLARQAVALLGPGFDAEIVEMHHRGKVDAPSGTAMRLADVVAAGQGLDPSTAVVTGRAGRDAARGEREVGVVALRGGGVVGEHTLVLAGPDERVELTHRAGDRSLFARGALRAARWVVGQPPGRYAMTDVLGVPP